MNTGHSHSRRRSDSSSGFTLVELLVVVGILILVTGASLLLLDHTDDQERYEKTRTGYSEIKRSIFGYDPMAFGGNETATSRGYIFDTGLIPTTLQDLATPPASLKDKAPWAPVLSVSASNLTAPLHPNIRIYSGWRGPYANPAGTGIKDGWGNFWEYDHLMPDGSIKLYSLGQAGDVAPYNQAYPPGEFAKFIPGQYVRAPAITFNRRKIDKKSIPASYDGKTVYVGVIYAGMIGTNLNPTFGSATNPTHPSLLYYPDTYTLKSSTRPKGSAVKIMLRKTKPNKPDKDYEDDDDDDDDLPVNAIPANLRFSNHGYARQIQFVLYDGARGGTPLRNKALAVDPTVFTYLPGVNTANPLPPTSQDPAIPGKWQLEIIPAAQ